MKRLIAATLLTIATTAISATPLLPAVYDGVRTSSTLTLPKTSSGFTFNIIQDSKTYPYIAVSVNGYLLNPSIPNQNVTQVSLSSEDLALLFFGILNQNSPNTFQLYDCSDVNCTTKVAAQQSTTQVSIVGPITALKAIPNVINASL